MIVRVPLTQNQYAVIDDEDLPLVEGYKWHASWSSTTESYYADTSVSKVNGKRPNLRMHRLITRCPKRMHVDHLNGNTLDNRRDNLTVCTPKEHVKRHASLITYCPKGHPYDEKNTYRKKNGHRLCRICINKRHRDRWNTNHNYRERNNARRRERGHSPKTEKNNEERAIRGSAQLCATWLAGVSSTARIEVRIFSGPAYH